MGPCFKSYVSYKFDRPETIRDRAKMDLAGYRVRRLSGNFFWALNREEMSFRHVNMVAKFLDDNKPKIHLKSEFTMFQSLSILSNFI